MQLALTAKMLNCPRARPNKTYIGKNWCMFWRKHRIDLALFVAQVGSEHGVPYRHLKIDQKQTIYINPQKDMTEAT